MSKATEPSKRLQVDVFEDQSLRSGWVRYELCDVTLKQIRTQWSDKGGFTFDRLDIGTYVVRVSNADNVSYAKVAEISDANYYQVSFGAENQPSSNIRVTYSDKSNDIKIVDRALKIDVSPIIKTNPVNLSSDLDFVVSRWEGRKWVDLGALKIERSSETYRNGQIIAQVSTGRYIHGLEIRNWLLARTAGRFMLLPPGGVVLTLLFSFAGISDLGVRITIDTNNAKADALGKLLVSGDVNGANSLVRFEDAQQLMQDKMEDHAAAAIGGYYLLRFRQFEYLHDWTSNLANWFPDMADGAIIHAWFILTKGPWEYSEPINGDFRNWLLKAEKRGIPLFSEGLKLLYEGLTQVWLHTNKTDTEVGRARSRVGKILVRLVPGQLYTTLDNYIPVTVGKGEPVTA